jgi:hypothetical protein
MRQFLGHKSMITVWLVLLFALWIVLTAALAVIGRHGKSRKTPQPPVIAAVTKFDPKPKSEECRKYLHRDGIPLRIL